MEMKPISTRHLSVAPAKDLRGCWRSRPFETVSMTRRNAHSGEEAGRAIGLLFVGSGVQLNAAIGFFWERPVPDSVGCGSSHLKKR